MSNRREFIVGSSLALGGLALGSNLSACSANSPCNAIANTGPRRALVAWFSQTGHTARLGKLMAETWRTAGLDVRADDIRGIDPQQAAQCDLLLIGAPVNYMDLPPALIAWLERLPDLSRTACAAYVTYGNKGNNQHNTACRALEIAANKGAACAGLETFSNMNTFSPSYSSASGLQRTLRYRHLPDRQEFERAQGFASQTLKAVREGRTSPIEREFDITGLAVPLNPAWWTKQSINLHRIEPAACIECGACEETCPTGAVALAAHSIDREKCVVCLGCVNNCPTAALEMEMFGKRVTGFKRMCEQQGIQIAEPQA